MNDNNKAPKHSINWTTWICIIYAGLVLDGTIPGNWFTFPLGLIAVGILVNRFLNW